MGAQDSRKITPETHIEQCWSCIGVYTYEMFASLHPSPTSGKQRICGVKLLWAFLGLAWAYLGLFINDMANLA